MADPKPHIAFETGVLPAETLQIVRLEGREAISSPYVFEFDLVSQKDDVDLAEVLQKPVALGVDRIVPAGNRTRLTRFPIHGVLRSFEQQDPGPKWSRYRAVLVPRFALLELTRHSRIFQEKTVKEIVGEVLEENGLKSDAYEFRLSGSYKAREYVVQYQESDLAFVSRLLEHEGIYYFFAQDDDQEKIVFADSTTAPEDLPGEATIVYRQPSGMGDFDLDDASALPREAVKSFVGRVTAVPAKVILKDYNYRKPSVELRAETDVAERGRGAIFEYGNHFKDNSEGAQLARVRSEEIRCREAVFDGRSDCRGLRAGFVFELGEGYRRDLDGRYLVTEVRHRATQHVAFGPFLAGESAEYANEFRAIRADVVFRPERRTPKPRIVGSINAHVDAAGSGEYAEIDDQGRYKVVLPFDLTGRKEAKASRFIRMAQPYAGADMGMHFPLHKGTEVILTHVDGDPDRPIIAAAVPNAETTGPVTGGNQTQCAIKTGGGNQIVFEDSAGRQRIKMSTPHGGTVLQLGSPNLPSAGVALQTTLDYFQKIGQNLITFTDGNASHEVKGNESTMNIGNVTSTVQGSKSEFVYGAYSGTVVGSKTEKALAVRTDITVGNLNTVTGGLTSSTLVGALLEILCAFKYSVGDTKELRKSRVLAAAKEKQTVADAVAAIASLKEQVGTQKTKIGSLEYQCAAAREQIGNLRQQIGNLEQKCGKFIVHATQIAITASRVAIHGGGAVVRATGGKVDLVGSGAKIEVGGTVGIRGSVVRLG